MASEATMLKLTAALEAMTNDREPNIKLEACPIKRKNCSLEAWISEVELWDNSNNVGELARLSTKKYLALMESIRKAEKMKSNITIDDKEKDKEEEESKTFYGYRDRYGDSKYQRGRSGDRNRWER